MWQCEWATACKWLLIKMAQLIMIITAQEDGEREKAEERKSDVLHLLWKNFKLEGPKKNLGRGTTNVTFSPSLELTNRTWESTLWYFRILFLLGNWLSISDASLSSSTGYGPIYTSEGIWPCAHSHVEMFRLGFSICKFGLCSKQNIWLQILFYLFVSLD